MTLTSYAQGPEAWSGDHHTSWEIARTARFTFNYRATSGGRVDRRSIADPRNSAPPAGSGTMT